MDHGHTAARDAGAAAGYEGMRPMTKEQGS